MQAARPSSPFFVFGRSQVQSPHTPVEIISELPTFDTCNESVNKISELIEKLQENKDFRMQKMVLGWSFSNKELRGLLQKTEEGGVDRNEAVIMISEKVYCFSNLIFSDLGHIWGTDWLADLERFPEYEPSMSQAEFRLKKVCESLEELTLPTFSSSSSFIPLRFPSISPLIDTQIRDGYKSERNFADEYYARRNEVEEFDSEEDSEEEASLYELEFKKLNRTTLQLLILKDENDLKEYLKHAFTLVNELTQSLYISDLHASGIEQKQVPVNTTLRKDVPIKPLFITTTSPDSNQAESANNFLLEIYRSGASAVVSFTRPWECYSSSYLSHYKVDEPFILGEGITVTKLKFQEDLDDFHSPVDMIRFEDRSHNYSFEGDAEEGIKTRDVKIFQLYQPQDSTNYCLTLDKIICQAEECYRERAKTKLTDLMPLESEGCPIMVTSEDGRSQVGIFVLSYILKSTLAAAKQEFPENFENFSINLAMEFANLRQEHPRLIVDQTELTAVYRMLQDYAERFYKELNPAG